MSIINNLLMRLGSNVEFVLAGGGGGGGAGGGGFDLGTFFDNLAKLGKEWGAKFIVFLGVILVVWGIVNIVKAFISQGRGQTNWLMTIAMLLVGGFLCAIGGWDTIQNFLNIGAGTITKMGET